MRLVATLMLLALAGCPKKDPPIANEDAGMPATPSGTASAGAIPPEASAPPSTSASFAGKYGVTPGTMYVGEADKAAVKFKNDESKFLGEGDLSLSIDPTGRVSGTTDPAGPLGASIIEGKSEGGTVTATIRRKDALDEGLTGTLVAKLSGDTLEGTMKLSEFNAAVVREATLKAKKK